MVGWRHVEEDHVWRLYIRTPFIQGLREQSAGTHPVIAALLVDHLPNRLGQVGASVPRLDHECPRSLRMIPGQIGSRRTNEDSHTAQLVESVCQGSGNERRVGINGDR